MNSPWTQPPFDKFYTYWHGLFIENGGPPPRSAFNPMKIAADMPLIQVLERDGTELSLRLTGTGIETVTQMKVAPGMSVRDLYTSEDYEVMLATLTTASETGQCLFAKTLRTIDETHTKPLNLLVVPFAQNDDGTYHYMIRGAENDDGRAIAEPGAPPIKLVGAEIFAPEGSKS